MVLVLHLIGRKGGASFIDQSQSVVKKKMQSRIYFRHLIENCSTSIWIGYNTNYSV